MIIIIIIAVMMSMMVIVLTLMIIMIIEVTVMVMTMNAMQWATTNMSRYGPDIVRRSVRNGNGQLGCQFVHYGFQQNKLSR